MPIRRLPPSTFYGLNWSDRFFWSEILLDSVRNVIHRYVWEKLGLKLIWVEVKQASNVEINHQLVNYIQTDKLKLICIKLLLESTRKSNLNHISKQNFSFVDKR
jgi:hypothetical protein